MKKTNAVWEYLTGKPETVSSTTNTTIEQLYETIESLDKRNTFLSKQVQQQIKIAKENATTNKKRALYALKKKKMFETQIEKLENTRLSLETQIITIENAHIAIQTASAFKKSAQALKNMTNNVNVKDIDNTMEDIENEIYMSNEFSMALAQGFSTDPVYDEDDLDADLDALLQEDEEKPTTPACTKFDEKDFPTAPMHHPISNQEKKDLEQLKKEFGLLDI